MKINNVGITGIGSYVPLRTVSNDIIDDYDIGTNSEWTKKFLGIENRNISSVDETTSWLGYCASITAIHDAGLTKNDIDLILFATSTPDFKSPSTACIMAERFGITCPAMDINAVCSGFIYGLQMASNLISTKQYKNILVVASERYSTITNWKDRNSVFFGDGAGAVVVSNVENSWISTDIFSDGKGKENFWCTHSGTFNMNGKAVYEFGTKILPRTILNSLDSVNLTTEDISWLIPHQPSIRILQKTAEILKLPIEKVVLNMMDNANTAGASIPMALDKVYKENKLKNNDILVMPAVGSGWTWGVTILKYYKK